MFQSPMTALAHRSQSFLIFGRIKVNVGIDQIRLGLSPRRDDRDHRGDAERAEPGQEAAP